MNMWRRSLCVSGRTDVAQDRASGHPIAYLNSLRVRVEMCVVINAATFTDYRNGLPAEVVFANPENITTGRGENRCTAGSEDVLPFVLAAIAARRLPCVRDRFLSDVF